MWLVSLGCLGALGSFRDLPGVCGAFVLDLRWLAQIENGPVAQATPHTHLTLQIRLCHVTQILSCLFLRTYPFVF